MGDATPLCAVCGCRPVRFPTRGGRTCGAVDCRHAYQRARHREREADARIEAQFAAVRAARLARERTGWRVWQHDGWAQRAGRSCMDTTGALGR